MFNRKNKSNLQIDTKGDRVFMICVYISLTLLSLAVLFPLLYVVSASFSSPQAVIEGRVFLWPVEPTLRGYEAVFKYEKILTGFKNSMFYMVVGTTVNIVMTLLCAYPLSRKEFRARKVLSVIFMFTMIFNGGLIPTFMVVQKLGLYNTRWALIIPAAMSIWNVMIARTYISNTIPDELYEAASIDGCTPWKYFHQIVLPLSKPIIAVLVLYYGVNHWNSYFNALIYIRKEALQPLQIALRNLLVMNQVDPSLVSNVQAMAEQQGLTDLLKFSTIVVASVPVLLIYPFVQKHFVKGVMIGSVKG